MVYGCPINTHKRPQPAISIPHDFHQHEKIGEIFRVIFTGVKFKRFLKPPQNARLNQQSV